MCSEELSSGVAPVGLIISRWASSVFIRMTFDRFANRPTPSLSASAPDVLDSGIPLLLPPDDASPRSSLFPVPVEVPLGNLDCEAILHPYFSMSSRKYFKYQPLFIGVLWKNCG
jgi:hypothetical protein